MAGIEFLPGGLNEASTGPVPRSAASTPSGDRGTGNLPAIPRLTFRRPEPLDRSPMLAGIHAKAKSGMRLTRGDRISVWADFMAAEIEPLLQTGKISTAIRELATALTGANIAHCEATDRLTDRIAELEAARRA